MSDPTSFASRYEATLVPVIFTPWAQEMLRRAAPQNNERILDLACGTGVVTRCLAAIGVERAQVTALDHNADMLRVAYQKAQALGIQAIWQQADAAALPLDDASIDLAICQQALQFFPDKPAALSELKRVMTPGGRIAFCVQRELAVNPMLKAQATALDGHVSQTAGDAVRAICSLYDPATLHSLFETAGFQQIEIESVCLELGHPDGRAFAEGAMGGMHTGDKLSPITELARQRCIDDFLAELGPCFDGQAIAFPHVSHVITALA